MCLYKRKKAIYFTGEKSVYLQQQTAMVVSKWSFIIWGPQTASFSKHWFIWGVALTTVWTVIQINPFHMEETTQEKSVSHWYEWVNMGYLTWFCISQDSGSETNCFGMKGWTLVTLHRFTTAATDDNTKDFVLDK